MKSVLLLISISLSLFSSAAQAQNINLSQGNVFDGEPYLAINPNDDQHLVVAWMGYVPLAQISIKTKTSLDGGQTWSTATNVPHTNSLFGSADPSLGFDNDGNVFLTYVDFQASIDSGFVYVRKSIDGGLSWGDPVTAIHMHSDGDSHPIDRPWMAIDNSGGPNDGNIYVTSMPPLTIGFIPPPYHPYFARSIDGGGSFEPWRYVDTTGFLVGSFIPGPMPAPAVGPDGTVHVAYPSWETNQSLIPQMFVASSTNGGLGFEYKTIYSSAQAFSDSLAKKGYLLRVDPSDADHLAFLHLNNPHGDGDVYIRESFDGGANWSSGLRLNDDPIGNIRMQDLVWADFDTDGDLVVSWRDRRNATDSTYTTETEIWATVRPKDSTDFLPNFPISDALVLHDSILEGAGNDFMNVQLENDLISAVWGDMRNGFMNIWFAQFSLEGVVNSVRKISSEAIPDVEIYPNPSTDGITVKGEGIRGVQLMDAAGRRVSLNMQQVNSNESLIDLTDLPKGSYILLLETQEGRVSKNVTKQ